MFPTGGFTTQSLCKIFSLCNTVRTQRHTYHDQFSPESTQNSYGTNCDMCFVSLKCDLCSVLSKVSNVYLWTSCILCVFQKMFIKAFIVPLLSACSVEILRKKPCKCHLHVKIKCTLLPFATFRDLEYETGDLHEEVWNNWGTEHVFLSLIIV